MVLLFVFFYLSTLWENLNIQSNTAKVESTFLFKLRALAAMTPLLSAKILLRVPVTPYQSIRKEINASQLRQTAAAC